MSELPTAPFGTVFTRRMAQCTFSDGRWGEPSIVDTGPIALHPGAHVLHYASACFEGLKAYRWPDDSVQIFRLDRHIERMRYSAQLLCLPVPPQALLSSMVCDAVAECRDEIPDSPGALYIRPTLIGTEPNVGAAGAPPREVALYVVLSPVGDYFSGGQRPLRILVDDQNLRTPTDFGRVKAGANYATALHHVVNARAQHSADQVLFCAGGHVQETGASNFLLISDDEVLTRPLDDSYLHGVTRDSLLTIARDLGYRVREENFTVEQMLEWIRLGEAAMSGTAAVLAGVGVFVYEGEEHAVRNGSIGPNTERLRQALTAIQAGAAPDEHGWLHRL